MWHNQDPIMAQMKQHERTSTRCSSAGYLIDDGLQTRLSAESGFWLEFLRPSIDSK